MKKDADIMELERSKFVNGCVKNGYDKSNSENLFEQIALYSLYQFNKSHSLAYSYISAYTAWLSANYPLEFFTAIMTICSDNTDDVRKAILALKERNLSVLPPSVNKSKIGFEIVDGSIVFGLSAIKGVGKAICNNVIKNRPKTGYKSFGHFVSRNISILNKKLLESFIKAGVFNEFGYSKNTLLDSIEYILEYVSETKSSTSNDIINILDIDLGYFIEACLISYSDKPDNVYYEADAIGMYITKHPMEEYVIDTTKFNTIDRIKAYDEDIDEFRVRTIGVVTGIEVRKTKAKSNMCTFLLTDKESSMGCTCFPTVYNKYINEIQEGRIVILDCTVRYDNGQRTLYPKTIELFNGSHVGLMRKMSANKVLPKKSETDIIVHKVGKLKFNLEKIDG